jgi:hypothetical protein
MNRGAGGGGGSGSKFSGGRVVVVVVVVVDVVVVVVVDVVVVGSAFASTTLCVGDESPPLNSTAEPDTTATAVTSPAPTNTRRKLSRIVTPAAAPIWADHRRAGPPP